MAANTNVFIVICLAATVLAGCDQAVTCVPEEVSRADAAQGQLALARRVAALGSGTDPIKATNPQVRVYLDVSYSLRGFITGSTCGDCLPRAAAPAKPAAGRNADPAAPFFDPLFSTLITNLTNLPLLSLPGAPIRYHVFAEDVAEVEQDVYGRIGRDYTCYDQSDPKNRKTIEENVYKPFRERCFFDSEKSGALARIGNRGASPFQKTLSDIVSALEDKESPIDEGLFVIATDLFIAKNQDVIGPNAAVVAPLARLVNQGFQVRLFGFQLPFSGRIDDAPAPNFQVRAPT